MFKHSMIIGWDVGGAHLKAAQLNAQGQLLNVIQVPCALWLGLPQLEQAITQVVNTLNIDSNAQHVVTMTGELADCFKNRQQGVEAISQSMAQRFGVSTLFYAVSHDAFNKVESRWLMQAQVAECYKQIASLNWYASAELLAKQVNDALLIDMGSSTTDIMVLHASAPMPRGLDDASRMQMDELVYTGVVRTPVMAVAQHVPFQGEWVAVAAEHFATMADVYRVLGQLDEAHDMASTADGREKSEQASLARLARMIGRDVNDALPSAWIYLAQAIHAVQLNQIQQAVMRQLSRNILSYDAPIIAVGAGAFFVEQLARNMNRKFLSLTQALQLSPSNSSHWASVCLPAYAVAKLYAEGLQ